MRPEPRTRLAVETAGEDDSTGWLVTFSDLVLQLFAFVVVSSVLASGYPGTPPRTAQEEARPAPAAPLADAPPPPAAEAAATLGGEAAGALAAGPAATRARREQEEPAGRALPAVPDEDTRAAAGPTARNGLIAAQAPIEAEGPKQAPVETLPAERVAGAAPEPSVAALPAAIEGSADTAREPHPEDVADSDPGRQAEAAASTHPGPQAAPEADAQLAAVARYLDALLRARGLDSGASVKVAGTEVVLSLSDWIGFASGRAELLPQARPLLRDLRETVRSMPGLVVDVAGHTDDVPIRTAEFPSNLELSLARAARVARELTEGVPALVARTFARGFGEHRPVAANGDARGRARNRRVEIRLVASRGGSETSPRPGPLASLAAP